MPISVAMIWAQVVSWPCPVDFVPTRVMAEPVGGLASDVGSGERQIFADEMHKQGARFAQAFDQLAVDFEFDVNCRHFGFSSSAGARQGAVQGTCNVSSANADTIFGRAARVVRRVHDLAGFSDGCTDRSLVRCASDQCFGRGLGQ